MKFGLDSIRDQDKSWAPHMVCISCVGGLKKWKDGKSKNFKFGVPMLWSEPQNHPNDCYFCIAKMKGFNGHKKKMWHYPNLESARRPIPHSENVPIPLFTSLPNLPLPDNEDIRNLRPISGSSKGGLSEGNHMSSLQIVCSNNPN